MRGVRGDEEMTATNGLAGRGFLFVVEDGCIFKHCAIKHRENRSWTSDLGAPMHGRMCAPSRKSPIISRNA